MTPLTFRYDVFIRPTSISIKRHVLGRTPLSPVYATYNGPTPALASRLVEAIGCIVLPEVVSRKQSITFLWLSVYKHVAYFHFFQCSLLCEAFVKTIGLSK